MAGAVDIFGGRLNVPSSKSAEEWGREPVGVRERAFWSAKVTHAQHVADLKAACLDSLEGARRRVRDLHMHRWTPEELEVEVDPVTHLPSPGSGVKRGDLTILMSREAIVGEMRKRALERGLTPTGPRPMEDIAHESRLRLIGQMAEDTARERARFERGNDPDILFAYPAQELIREEAREKPRDWATRWRAAADDVGWEGVARSGEWIARKDSPIWVALSAFGQPFPPFDYNSGMGVMDVDRGRAVELGLVEEDEEIANPGDVFRETCSASVQGMDDTEREWLKRTIEEAQGGEVAFTPDGRVEWTPPAPTPPPPEPPAPGPSPADTVRLKQVQARLVEQLRARQAQMEADARAKEAADREAERKDAERARLVQALKAEAERRRGPATAGGGGRDDGGKRPPVASGAAEPDDLRARFDGEFARRMEHATEKQRGEERRKMIERVLAETWTTADGLAASEAATEESSLAEIEMVRKGKAEIAVLPLSPGLSRGVILDTITARHIVQRRNAQRAKRIRDAKRSGDKEALRRAEEMLAGEEVLRLIPRNMKQGSISRIRTNEEQKRENLDIDGPELHLAISRALGSHRTKEAPVYLELTAFPSDEEFARSVRHRK